MILCEKDRKVFYKVAHNLHLVADFLDAMPEENTVQMEFFFTDNNGLEIEASKLHLDADRGIRHWCGTCACVLGWATSVPQLPILTDHIENGALVMSRYAGDYFGLPFGGPRGGVWSNCFSAFLSDGRKEAANRCREYAKYLEDFAAIA